MLLESIDKLPVSDVFILNLNDALISLLPVDIKSKFHNSSSPLPELSNNLSVFEVLNEDNIKLQKKHYSTVTTLAKFRGISGFKPRCNDNLYDNIWRGITLNKCLNVLLYGILII